MRRRTAVVGVCVIVACTALAGCSVVTAGRPVPADGDGLRPVRTAALPEVLLDATTVNDIMGATRMTVADSRTELFSDATQFADRDCMIAWTPVEKSVYAHSDWSSMTARTLVDNRGRSDHFVVQAVVAFPSRAVAQHFFDAAVDRWTPCGDRTFETRRPDDDTAVAWTFGAVANADSTLWMTQRQDRGMGWSCERALRVSNNVAIDVLACKFYATDEAITIAEGIDARLPSI